MFFSTSLDDAPNPKSSLLNGQSATVLGLVVAVFLLESDDNDDAGAAEEELSWGSSASS